MTKTNFDDFAQDYEQLASQPTKRFDSDPSYFARYKVEIMKRVAGRPPPVQFSILGVVSAGAQAIYAWLFLTLGLWGVISLRKV